MTGHGLPNLTWHGPQGRAAYTFLRTSLHSTPLTPCTYSHKYTHLGYCASPPHTNTHTSLPLCPQSPPTSYITQKRQNLECPFTVSTKQVHSMKAAPLPTSKHGPQLKTNT